MVESQKREREQLTRALRTRGATWVEVAAAIRDRYGVNARVAFRLARGWSQERVADEWNSRWPDDRKTSKKISYWEQWPATTGHAHSLDVLSRLSELYACRVSDLVTDISDYRHSDEAHTENQALASTPPSIEGAGEADQTEILLLDILNTDPTAHNAPTSMHLRPDSGVDFDELARVISMWAQQWNPNVGRRNLLKLSTALAVAAASPGFNVPEELDDAARVARFVSDPANFDEAALRYCEDMVINLRRQGDVVGPKLTIQSVMGHRELASRLAHLAPAKYQKRATSAYAELTQLMGWLSFNLGDYRGAQQYYDDARTAAHDAEDVELVTYVLCTMSHLATWQGRPRVGIDHAAAAAVWAEQADSTRARAYAADVAVRAYLAANQRDRGLAMLEREYARVIGATINAREKALWYFYDESFYWATETQFRLKFDEPEKAMHAADKSLALVDPSNLHERAHRSLHRADVLIKQDSIDGACALIGEVAAITAVSSSQRVDQRISGLRGALAPWRRARAVKELDELLQSYRSAVIGSGK